MFSIAVVLTSVTTMYYCPYPGFSTVHTYHHSPEAQAVIVSGVHERSFIGRVHWVDGKERVRLSINDLLSTYRYTISWSLVLDTACMTDQQHRPQYHHNKSRDDHQSELSGRERLA